MLYGVRDFTVLNQQFMVNQIEAMQKTGRFDCLTESVKQILDTRVEEALAKGNFKNRKCTVYLREAQYDFIKSLLTHLDVGWEDWTVDQTEAGARDIWQRLPKLSTTLSVYLFLHARKHEFGKSEFELKKNSLLQNLIKCRDKLDKIERYEESILQSVAEESESD